MCSLFDCRLHKCQNTPLNADIRLSDWSQALIMNVPHVFSVVVLSEQGVNVGCTVWHRGSCRHCEDHGEFTVLNHFSRLKHALSQKAAELVVFMSRRVIFFRTRHIFLQQIRRSLYCIMKNISSNRIRTAWRYRLLAFPCECYFF